MKQSAAAKKASGFYVGVLGVILCILSAVMYRIKFSSISYKEPVYDSRICVILIVAAAAALIMLLFPKIDGFAPALLCAASGISLLMYVKMIIWPISDTIYGIEPFQHMDALILCAVLLALSFLVSEVSLYLRKRKPAATV